MTELIIKIVFLLFMGIITIDLTFMAVERLTCQYLPYKRANAKKTKKYKKNNTIVLTLARQSELAKQSEISTIVYSYTKTRKDCDNFNKTIIEDFVYKNKNKIGYGIYGYHVCILDLYAKHMYRYNESTNRFDMIPCRMDGEIIYISEYDEKENIFKDIEIGYVGKKDFESNGYAYTV